MEDGDTEKYHPSSVIQDFVFSSRKVVVSDVFLCRYIIKVKSRQVETFPNWSKPNSSRLFKTSHV